MAEPIFDPSPQLGHRLVMAVRNEDRVVAEPGAAGGTEREGTPADSLECSDQPAPHRKRHDADKPGLTAGNRNRPQFPKKFFDVGLIHLVLSPFARSPPKIVGGGVPGRAHTGPAAQCPHLQPGILRQNRKRGALAGLNRFLDGVGAEGGTALPDGWKIAESIGRDEPQGTTLQQEAEFPDLVPVARGEENGEQGSFYGAPRRRWTCGRIRTSFNFSAARRDQSDSWAHVGLSRTAPHGVTG